jgi:hypothetical protein
MLDQSPSPILGGNRGRVGAHWTEVGATSGPISPNFEASGGHFRSPKGIAKSAFDENVHLSRMLV